MKQQMECGCKQHDAMKRQAKNTKEDDERKSGEKRCAALETTRGAALEAPGSKASELIVKLL